MLLVHPGSKAIESDSSVNDAHWKISLDWSEQIAEPETLTEKDEETPKKDRLKEVQLLDKCKGHGSACLEMLIEHESMWDERTERVDIAKQRFESFGDKVRPVHPASYQERPTAREFAVAIVNCMIPEKVIEPHRTERALLIVFSPTKDGSLRSCTDYRKLNAIVLCNSYHSIARKIYIDS